MPLTTTITNAVSTATSDFMNAPGAHDILTNMATSFPGVMKLIGAVAYCMGVYMILHGIIKLYYEGSGSKQPGNTHGVASALWAIALGSLLLYLPWGVGTVTDTIMATSNNAVYSPLDYQTRANVSAQVNDMMKVIYQFIGIVGFIAFIRGIMVLKATTDGDQQAGIAKGLIFLAGGAIAINLQGFIDIIKATVGIT